MKQYSPLIRKLVEATAEAESKGQDVADLLRRRCFNDTSIIRQTLMNAVCDPRFKIYSNTVGFWKEEARSALEELAEQLSNIKELSVEDANCMLEAFLTAWFRMTFNKIVIQPVATPSNVFEPSNKKKPNQNVEDGLRMLEEVEKEFKSGRKNGNSQAKSRAKAQDASDTDSMPESDEDNDQQKGQQQQSQSGKNWSTSKNRIEQLEDRFLRNIPQSLVELARKIGRMGEDGVQKEGRFHTAAKSDISGITVGNELSSVLPSELALLAEPMTQNIFLSNYSARRLQLFASASQVQSPQKHQDGPVIICVDTSGSMAGNPVIVAKALAIAVSIIAWRRKRNVFVVKYADRYDYLNMGCNRSRLGELSSFFSTNANGGNNENDMFLWLFKDVVNNLSDYQSADILCISDFGWCKLNERTTNLINAQKKNGMRLYGLNISPDFFAEAESEEGELEDSPMDICDSVWLYENGTCREIKN